MTLLLINLSPSITHTASLAGVLDVTTTQRSVVSAYELTAGDGTAPKWRGLDSQHIRINGNIIDAPIASSLPPPMRISTKCLTVKPLTITFVTGIGTDELGSTCF